MKRPNYWLLAACVTAGVLLKIWAGDVSAQDQQPVVYSVTSIPSAGTVYWFETSDAECYVLSAGYGSGISCLRKVVR